MIDRYVAPEPTITPEQQSKLEACVKPVNLTDLSRLPETMIESAANPAAALPGLPQDTPATTEVVPNYSSPASKLRNRNCCAGRNSNALQPSKKTNGLSRDIVEPGTLTIFSGLALLW